MCFVLLAISGLAFLPGVLLADRRVRHAAAGAHHPPVCRRGDVYGLCPTVFRYWHHNLITPGTCEMDEISQRSDEGHEVGDIGKYNGGQKACSG